MKMNIRAKVLALSAAIIAAGAIGIGVSSSNAAENSTSKANTQKIGIERANQIALEAVPGKIKSVELEKENGKTYYDYEIIKDNKEYDVHIDAYSGQTLKVKIDDDATEQKQQGTEANGNKPVTSPSSKPSSTPAVTPAPTGKPANTTAPTSKPSSTPATTAPTSQPAQKQLITVEKAAELAAKHVEGTVKKIKLEKEDGKRIYEVKLKSSHGKVEVEIDAYTGEILDVDYDNYKHKKDKEYYKEQNKYKNKNPNRDKNCKDKDDDDDDDDRD